MTDNREITPGTGAMEAKGSKLWQRLLGRLVSEYGRLCHWEGGARGATAAGGR